MPKRATKRHLGRRNHETIHFSPGSELPCETEAQPKQADEEEDEEAAMEEDVKPGKATKAKGKARGKKVAAVPKAAPAKAAEPKAAAKPKATKSAKS